MAWLHASGYPPANEHVGYPVSVLNDDTDTAVVSLRLEPHVTGWRAACECGWRGDLFYPRSEWPSHTGRGTAIDGWETRTGMFAEWSRHLDRAVPDCWCTTTPVNSPTSLNTSTTPCGPPVGRACRGGVSAKWPG